MADTKISALTDGVTLNATDRIPLARSPFGSGDNRYVTGTEIAAAVGREKLLTSRTYYVRTDGNDSNTGLANTAGGAFLTIQKAINVAGSLDYASLGQGVTIVTINVAAGTYTENLSLPHLVGGNFGDFNNEGLVNLVGDETTPANVVINGITENVGTNGWCFKGFTITSGNIGIWITEGGILRGKDLTFDCIKGMLLYDHSQFWGYDITFKDSFTNAIEMKHGSFFYHTSQGTLVASGSGSYSDAFIRMESGSKFVSEGTITVGSITGPRYNIGNGCIIETNGGTLADLPGNSFGTAIGGAVINGQEHFGSAKSINNTSGNEVIKFPSTVASAVNEITISNAATGVSPSISASGGDTDIGLTFSVKGDPFPSLVYNLGGSNTASVRYTATAASLFGPAIEIYHNSASPAADDLIARIRFLGNDLVTLEHEYASIQAKIVDTTDTSESVAVEFFGYFAGLSRKRLGLSNGAILGNSTSYPGVDNAYIVGSLELGHASDTTIARSGAGTVTIEGNTIATLSVENQTFSGGFTVTEKDLGTVTTGTTTLDMGDRLMQKYINGGAHTLAPGAVIGNTLVSITNNASAGVITTSGWTKVSGDSFTTTNTHKFLCRASVSAVGSLLRVEAMQ